MDSLQRALERYGAQERERELARQLRCAVTRSILTAGDFQRMRAIIPAWWEWVCTGVVYGDDGIAELIDDRLARTAGLEQAIIEDWG
jgi:hypothetical protein